MADNNTDGITLLGRSEAGLPESPDQAVLETFPNRNTGRDYVVELDCPDFGSLCPVTGQPDAARVRIAYIPAERCVETKSLKFYLASFRNHASFNEDIVNRILDDIVTACEPREAVVRGEFAARGGISLSAEARYPEAKPGPLEFGQDGGSVRGR